MICQLCRDVLHERCRGGTWCDCQHQPAHEFNINWPLIEQPQNQVVSPTLQPVDC